MEEETQPIHHSNKSSKLGKIFIAVLVLAVVIGAGAGYVLATSSGKVGNLASSSILTEKPKSAAVDNRTFRDFAEGKLTKKAVPKNGDYSEGTHILVRQSGVPVALTSSVIDLTLFEGKQVKVYGETQKAVKEGWLMDVGKVEEVQAPK